LILIWSAFLWWMGATFDMG